MKGSLFLFKFDFVPGKFMLRLFLFLFIVAFPFYGALPQSADSTKVDLVDVVIGRKKFKAANKIRADKKVHFSFFPAPVSTPGGGKAVITMILQKNKRKLKNNYCNTFLNSVENLKSYTIL
jgi:hypothetical protein